MIIEPTPGPWHVVEPRAIDYRQPLVYGRGGDSLIGAAEGGGRKIAVPAPEARANAKLFAGSLRLLEVCRKTRDLLSSCEEAGKEAGKATCNTTVTLNESNVANLLCDLRSAILDAELHHNPQLPWGGNR